MSLQCWLCAFGSWEGCKRLGRINTFWYQFWLHRFSPTRLLSLPPPLPQTRCQLQAQVTCVSYRLATGWRFPWPPPGTSDASRKSRLLPVFWPTGYNSEVSNTTSSGSVNLLEQLTKLRETFYLIDYLFIIKGMPPRNSQIEEMNRASHGERVWTSHALSRCPILSEYPCVHQPEALWTPSFWVFREASSHSHDWLNHWPLAIDSTSIPSPLPWGQGGETESSNPLITGLGLLTTSPPF